MNNLKNQVCDSGSQLQAAWQALSRRGVSTILPSECYERWEKLAELHSLLQGTMPLFEIRDKAWSVVESLVDPRRIQSEQNRYNVTKQGLSPTAYNFSHDGIEMDFANARHLTLVSYVSVSWSIYDRITNVCGRIAATDEVIQHPKQNPKLVEDILNKSKERNEQNESANKNLRNRSEYKPQLLAFSTQHQVRMAFEWPIRVSYSIRNWLVHEGQSMGNTRLFHSDRIEDGLTLHSEAVNYIETNCNLNWNDSDEPMRCCLRGSENPWKRGACKDLGRILRLYHNEVDSMLAGLVKWSTDSFIAQVAIFSERDKITLNTGVVTKSS